MERARLVLYPDERLRVKCEPVPEGEGAELVAALVQVLEREGGAGLAAPQIGSGLRVCVIGSGSSTNVLINPEIVKRSKKTSVDVEGCLSMPGTMASVRRNNSVTVRARDLNGDTRRVKATGFMARVMQHEIDHLDGILIIDRKEA